MKEVSEAELLEELKVSLPVDGAVLTKVKENISNLDELEDIIEVYDSEITAKIMEVSPIPQGGSGSLRWDDLKGHFSEKDLGNGVHKFFELACDIIDNVIESIADSPSLIKEGEVNGDFVSFIRALNNGKVKFENELFETSLLESREAIMFIKAFKHSLDNDNSMPFNAHSLGEYYIVQASYNSENIFHEEGLFSFSENDEYKKSEINCTLHFPDFFSDTLNILAAFNANLMIALSKYANEA